MHCANSIMRWIAAQRFYMLSRVIEMQRALSHATGGDYDET